MSANDILHAVDEEITQAAANEKLEAGYDHATLAARELKDGAVLKAQELKDTALHRVEEARRKVESSIKDVKNRAEQRTRAEPAKSLLYAFGIGFVVGFLFRR